MLRLIAVTFLVAHTAFAMYPAHPQDANMPVKEIRLGEENEVEVGPEGVRIKMQLGNLKPGWYQLIEEGYDENLPKEGNRYFEGEDNSRLLGFYVHADLSKDKKRFALVTKEGDYEFSQILRSQENFRSLPIDDFDASKWTNQGVAIDPAEFENFPDCPFVNNMPRAGSVQKVRYTLTRLDQFDAPETFIQKIKGMMRFH